MGLDLRRSVRQDLLIKQFTQNTQHAYLRNRFSAITGNLYSLFT